MGLFWCGNLNNTPFRSHYLPPFKKRKTLRHSLGRPSRSDLVLSEDNLTKDRQRFNEQKVKSEYYFDRSY